MRKLTALILTSTISACLLGSCNKPAGDGEATPPAAPGASSNKTTISINTPEAPAATPGAATPATPDGSAATAGTKSMPVAPVDLSGKWIALFGRTAGGSTLDEAYKSGEIIEFKNDGGILWTKKVGEAPATMTYSVEGTELTLNPGAAMNVGRDDEVGLMNVGRDDEVGLNKAKETQKSEVGKGALKKTLFRDGSFLAVIGQEHDIMVYGKYDGGDPPMPSISGNYTGEVAGAGTVPAAFAIKEGVLEARISENQGIFKGVYAHGYFIGVTNGSVPGSGLAALTPTADGKLDGILLPMPFTSMNSSFDFAPGQ